MGTTNETIEALGTLTWDTIKEFMMRIAGVVYIVDDADVVKRLVLEAECCLFHTPTVVYIVGDGAVFTDLMDTTTAVLSLVGGELTIRPSGSFGEKDFLQFYFQSWMDYDPAQGENQTIQFAGHAYVATEDVIYTVHRAAIADMEWRATTPDDPVFGQFSVLENSWVWTEPYVDRLVLLSRYWVREWWDPNNERHWNLDRVMDWMRAGELDDVNLAVLLRTAADRLSGVSKEQLEQAARELDAIPGTSCTAGCGADPYVFPVVGPPIKLPNHYALYRMYQDRSVFVDAEVDRRTVDGLEPGALSCGATPVRTGYYITRLRSAQWTVDTTSAACLDRPDLPWENAVAPGRSGDIPTELGGIIHGAYRSRTLRVSPVVRIEIRVYENPQILNAFVWSVPPRSDGRVDGLVYRNYTPSQYVSSGKYLDTPFIPRPKGPPRLLVKTIVGHGEVAESVTHAHLFNAMFRGGSGRYTT
jgi:hypothetical protein